MESSSRRSDQSSSYVDHTYKSCISPLFNSLEHVADALLRCLGFRSPADDTTPTTTTSSNLHHQTPQSISTKEELEDVGVKSRSRSRSIGLGGGGGAPRAAAAAAVRLNNNNRKPPRPPVSSGKGGQNN